MAADGGIVQTSTLEVELFSM